MFDTEIKGIKNIQQKIPKEIQYWHYFSNIISFCFEKEFDCEEWRDICNGHLIISDSSRKYVIRLDLKNMYGNLSIELWDEVSGLDIECLKNRGYETDCAFHIYDFEQSGLSVYCEEINAVLIEMEGETFDE